MFCCILCINNIHENDTIGLNMLGACSTVRDIIIEHFWFANKFLDASTKGEQVICKTCWMKLEYFHSYYQTVKANHNVPAGETIDVKDMAHYDHEHEQNQEENDLNYSDTKEELVTFVKYEVLDESNEVIEEELQSPTMMEEINCKNEYGSDTDMFVEYEEEAEIQEGEEIEEVEEFKPRVIKMRIPSQQKSVKIKTEMEISESLDDDKIRSVCLMYCEICSVELSSLREAKGHYSYFHKMKGYLICCGRKFNARCRLLEHINVVHLHEDTFRCEECNKSFASSRTLTLHHAVHITSKTFLCDLCPKNFATKNQIRAHVHNTHRHDNIEPGFVCILCEKIFVSEQRLKLHLNKVHDPSNNFVCEICSKQVKGKDGLSAHLKTHEVIRSEDRIQCNVCGNYQKDMKSYKVHMKKHSESEEDRICPECGKTSASIKALKYHIKFVHQTSRTFQCQNCPKAFKKKIHLIDHNATHTGEDIYSCPFCPKTFKNNSNMHAHKKNMHKAEYETIKPSYLRAII